MEKNIETQYDVNADKNFNIELNSMFNVFNVAFNVSNFQFVLSYQYFQFFCVYKNYVSKI